MKKILTSCVVLVMALLVGMGPGTTTAEAGSFRVKGVWVSCFEFEQVGLSNKTESEFRKNANTLFGNIKSSGCNTVYFHVRSHDDAIYPSSVTGWSKWVSRNKTALPYNPLKILVEYAHKYGLKFHAWMNPYRITSKKVLDPSKEETVDRIVAQVKEIVNNYGVDGIHFDDYFYPTNEKKYNGVDTYSRMEYVNEMVRKVYKAVKAKSSRLQFGISPSGNVKYCEKIGADVKTWMSKSGYVDYIIPQIYWSDQYLLDGKKTALFKERLAEWRSLNQRDVPMYIGLALYKGGYSLKDDLGWKKRSNNIANQLAQIKAGNTEGYVLFSYTNFYSAKAAKEMKNYLAKIGTVKLNKKKKTLRAGKTFKLSATVAPARISGKVKWKSSNGKIATVTRNGTVKAKRKGKVKIYAYCGKLKQKCDVKVLAKKKTSKKSSKKKKK